MRRLLAATPLLLLAIWACAPAASAQVAAPGVQRTIVRVGYSASDVQDRAGARALMDRIARAAGAACGGGPDSLMDDDAARFDRCRLDAFGRAVSRLDPRIIAAMADGPRASPPVATR